MATSYIFNFTDPWTTSFNVNAFSSNGPVFPLSAMLEATAVAANTSFVLYGKGHPNYGERIQENLVHLLETMSGSVEPAYPISGQQWFRRYDIVRTGGSSWFQWNVGTLSWDAFTPTVLPIITFVHGDIFTDGAPTPALTRVINEVGHPLSPSAVPIVWQDLATLPTEPQLQLMMYDGAVWKAQNTVRSSDVEPTGAGVGDMWFDTNTNQLKIWDGTTFIPTADLYLPLAGGTMTGAIDMGGLGITSMLDPVSPQDAATKFYVDAALGTSVTKMDDLLDVTFGTPTPDPSIATPFLRHDSALVGSQDQTSYTGVGNFGSFVGGDGIGGTAYAPGDTITLSNGTILTVGSVDANGDVLTFSVTNPGLNAADGVTLTQTSTSGTGTDFTLTPGIVNIVGWKASSLLLADVSDVTSSVAQVNFLDTTISDVQIQLDGKLNLDGTNTMAATLDMGSNFIIDLLDPINPQDAATRFYVIDHVATEIAAIGGTDTYVTGASLNTIIGNPEEGWLTIAQANGALPADIIIAGFAVQGHIHTSVEIPHTPPSTSEMVGVTEVSGALSQLEEITRTKTSPRRGVETLLGAGSGPFSVVEHEVGRHKLQVWVNGIKMISNLMAEDGMEFTFQVDGSTDTGLAASTPYAFDITLDGVGPTTVSFTTPAFTGIFDFVDLVAAINTALGLATLAATCVFEDGVLEFFSDDQSGATASVVLATAGAGTDLAGAITGSGGFTGYSNGGVPVPGIAYGYAESGKFGADGLTITTTAALSIGDVIESWVPGGNG